MGSNCPINHEETGLLQSSQLCLMVSNELDQDDLLLLLPC
jgi:hypothetical protein